MASARHINRLSGLLAVNMIEFAHQSTNITNRRRQLRTRAKHSKLKSRPPLMRRLGIHKNIPATDTKLTLGLRVGFNSSHLTTNKLFQVNPRDITNPLKMSLLVGTSSIIIKPRRILVFHTDDLGWYITSNQQGQMFVQNLTRIVSTRNVTPGQILYCTTSCIPINLMFQEYLPTNTQISKSLCHRNDHRQRRVISATYGCYNSNPY